MKITVISVGKIREKFFSDAISEYKKRLSRFAEVNIIEVKDENPSITFIIGGSLGLCEKVKSASDMRLSFGKITLPHQLMRVVLLEQIYRAFKISSGETYHK